MAVFILILVFQYGVIPVTGQSVTAPGDAVAGRSITLECRITRPTGDTSPLIWSRVNPTISPIYTSTQCTSSIRLLRQSPEGLSGGCQNVNGEEVFTLTIQNVTGDTGLGSWQCQYGANSVNATLDVKVMVTGVTVRNPPDAVLAGDPVTFTCVTPASKPQACIRGYIRNSGNVRLLDPRDCSKQSSSVQTTNRTLTFTASAADNGAELYCNASNNVTDPPVQSQVYTLNVQFGPGSVQLQQDAGGSGYTVTVTEYNNVTFTCSSGESNRASVLSWYNNSSPIAPAKISEMSSQRGPNQGHRTIQRYTLTVDRYQDGDVISCEAQRPGITRSKRASPNLRLNMSYGPIITSCQSSYIFVENDTVELSCTIWAKPEPTISWSRGAQPSDVSVTHHRYTSAVRFSRISRTDSGVYTVTASNTVRSGEQRTVNVTVFYPPDVSVALVSGDNLTEGNSLRLECRAEAVPQNYTYSVWSRTIGDRPVPLTNSSPGRYLSISQVTFRDQGVYRCGASNGFGGIREGELDVRVRARPLFSTQNNLQAASQGDNVKLRFEFVSYPSYSNLIWHKMTNGTFYQLYTSDTTGSKYRRHVTTTTHEFSFYDVTVLLPGYQAELEISNINRHDFGLYTLRVENKVGFSEFNVSLMLKDRPCSPLLGVAVCGSESANISWISCFNGGSTQIFEIEYKRESEQWKQWERNIPDPGEGKTVREEVTGLTDVGLYTFRVYGQNVWNKSDPSVTTCAVKGTAHPETQTQPGVVAAAILTPVVVILAIALAVFVYLWRKGKKTGAANGQTNGEMRGTNSGDEASQEMTGKDIRYEALNFQPQGPSPPISAHAAHSKDYVNVNFGAQRAMKKPIPAKKPKIHVYQNTRIS